MATSHQVHRQSEPTLVILYTEQTSAYPNTIMAHLERPPRAHELILQRRPRPKNIHPLDHGNSGRLRQ